MEAFVHQLVSGLATGGIYAALALALVMIYQSTHHLNFVQGEMAMFSAYVAWSLIDVGLGYWTAFLLTLALSFLGGMALERTLIRRFNDRPLLTVVIVMIGLLLVFNSLAGWIWTYTMKTFPSPFPTTGLTRFASGHEFGMLTVILMLLLALWVFFRYTPLGLAMRAAAQNPVSSRLVGIRVDRLLALGWGLAAAIGAVAGMMIAPIVYLDPNMMAGVLVYSFAAALVGGIDNPLGAVVGGLIVGVAENLLGAYVIGTQLKLTAAFVFIVVVLLICPSGILGRRLVTRV